MNRSRLLGRALLVLALLALLGGWFWGWPASRRSVDDAGGSPPARSLPAKNIPMH